MLPALWKTKKFWCWEQKDLSPVGILCTQGEQLHVWLCPLCALSKKQPWPWLFLVCSGKKKSNIFPVSWCFFPFAPTQPGWPRSSLCNSIHGSSSCSQNCWSIPLHCRHCGQGKGSISWLWIVSKDIAELLALNENIYLLFLAPRSFIIVLF